MAMNFNASRNANKMNQLQQRMGEESNALVSKNLPMSAIIENEDNETVYGMEKIENLKKTIDEDGFDDPIGVYNMGDGTYEIFSGHKRYRAMKAIGAKTIPAVVFPKYKDKIERARRLIKSNSLNRDYTPLQRARELQYYLDQVIIPENKPGRKRDQLAAEFGISSGTCAKLLSLLKLIKPLQELSNHPELSFSAFSPASQLTTKQQEMLYQFVESTKDEEGSYHVTRESIELYIKKLQGKDSITPMNKPEEQILVPKQESGVKEKESSSSNENPRAEIELNPETITSSMDYADESLKEMISIVRKIQAKSQVENKKQARKYIAEIREKLDVIEKNL